MILKNRSFSLLIILGFLLRASLLFVDFSFDVNNHLVWAKDLWSGGFFGFYERQSTEVYATLYPNYPPLSLFMFYLIYPLPLIIYQILWFLNITVPIFPSKLIFFIQDRAFLAGFFKLPAVLADLFLAGLCFHIVQKLSPKNKSLPPLAAGLILFNPAFFDNSALWGQIDVIPLMFSVLSFYLILYRPRLTLSMTLFTLGLLIKPTILVFLPIYLIVVFKKFPLRRSIKAIFVGNFIFYISFLPFWGQGYDLFSPYIVYIKKILETQSLPYVTNGAFNFWVLISYFDGIVDTAQFLFGLSYRTWGYLFVGLIYLYIMLRLLKKGGEAKIFYGLFFGALASFVFLTKMHERYSMLPLPFLLLAAVKNNRLLWWFVGFSLISYLNLYHSWPVPQFEPIIAPLHNRFVVIALSSFNLVTFFYLLWRYHRQSLTKDT